ncbi:MAG TPA: hypothetical protein VGI81_02825 [Tepidisphaeraceae bacterium]|jgi:hypothetical protein
MPYAELADALETYDRRKPESAGILSAVLDVYQEQGFERGYERAMHDLLASLVSVTEQYLIRQDSRSGETRRLLYGYVEFLEDHIRRASDDAAYVSDGLGI